MHIYFSEENEESKKCQIKKGPRKPSVPFGLKVYKGTKSVIMSRKYAEFLTQHPVATQFEDFLKDTWIPDEHLYASMSRITNITKIRYANRYIILFA